MGGRALALVVLSGLAACTPPSAAPVAEAPGSGGQASVAEVTTDGARQTLLFLAPDSHPSAAVVVFPGGDGAIGIGTDGSIARGGNVLIRTRRQWVAQGFLFVAVDAAAARAGTRGDRVGGANQRAIAAIVQAVHQRTDAPIWLVGTSAGAPAAVAGAASLPRGAIHGVVISSPVSQPGPRDTVFDAALDRIAVPVLIQVHRDDQCSITPPGNAARIKAALTAAPVVEIQEFSGGDFPRSTPCEAFAQHGFLGIESQVVDATAAWIRAH
jgi:predicted alpha/beta-hydrolase family hydrolase